MENRIKKAVIQLGADLCGIANIDRFKDAPSGFHPKDIYSDCKSVVVFAKRMPKGLAFVNPRIAYNNAADTILKEIDRLSILASVEIEKLGGIAVPVPSDSPYEYWDNDKKEGRGVLSMKHAAVLAGIGCMGKNTLIINKKFGNMINIGTVLTNLDLKSDQLAENLCIENCRKCLDECPQKALDGVTIIQKLCRERSHGRNEKGFDVCNCNRCRMICPMVFGEKA